MNKQKGISPNAVFWVMVLTLLLIGMSIGFTIATVVN